MKRLSIDIPNELHHMLKVHASYKECKIKDFVTKAIQSAIKIEQKPRISKNIPNAETIKTFEESKQGIGLQEFTSVEDMFNEIYQELEDEGFKIKRHYHD
jgi:uncharacterized protein (UPF0335 family)